MGVADATSSERFITLGGKQYRMARWSLRHVCAVEEEILRHRVNPLDAIKPHLKDLSEAQGKALLEAAYKELNSQKLASVSLEERAEFGATVRGIYFSIWLLLREHQPHLKLEEVSALVDGASPEELKELTGAVRDELQGN